MERPARPATTALLWAGATAVFLTELAALVGLALGGWSMPGPAWARVLLAALLPVVAAAVWGAFLAPRASRPLAEPSRIALRAVVLAAGAAGFAASGRPVLAWAVLAGVVVATLAEPRLRTLTGGDERP